MQRVKDFFKNNSSVRVKWDYNFSAIYFKLKMDLLNTKLAYTCFKEFRNNPYKGVYYVQQKL